MFCNWVTVVFKRSAFVVLKFECFIDNKSVCLFTGTDITCSPLSPFLCCNTPSISSYQPSSQVKPKITDCLFWDTKTQRRRFCPCVVFHEHLNCVSSEQAKATWCLPSVLLIRYFCFVAWRPCTQRFQNTITKDTRMNNAKHKQWTRKWQGESWIKMLHSQLKEAWGPWTSSWSSPAGVCLSARSRTWSHRSAGLMTP